MASKVIFALFLALVGYASAQAVPASAGVAVDGIWNYTVNGNTYEAHCVGVNDYDQVENIGPGPNANPPLVDGGTIFTESTPANVNTLGKLHCRYERGLLQMAIQENSLQLNGRWYTGGWAGCPIAAGQSCYVGGISMSRATTGSNVAPVSFTGSATCDDDANPGTDNSNLGVVSMTWDRALDNTVFLSVEQQQECAVIKHQQSYDEEDPNNGPTFRDSWDFKENTVFTNSSEVARGSGAWDICIDTVDFESAGDDYRSSFDAVFGESAYYEQGLISFNANDIQLLVNFKIGTGCYIDCGGQGNGLSVLAVLYNDDMLNLFSSGNSTTNDTLSFSSDLYDSTGQIPKNCARREALAVDPNTACPPDNIAGINVAGVWSIGTNGTTPAAGPARVASWTASCSGVNDYQITENLNGNPPALTGGIIPTTAGITDGKLHCRYPAGFMQMAIQNNSTSLIGRWYEGGYDQCSNVASRTCFVGTISLSRSNNTDNTWTGTYYCDDDETPGNAGTNTVVPITLTLTANITQNVDGITSLVPFFQLSPIVGQIKRPSVFNTNDPNAGPTFRDSWDQIDNTARDGSWDICINTVDFNDDERPYRSSFDADSDDSQSYYEQGYIHYLAVSACS